LITALRGYARLSPRTKIFDFDTLPSARGLAPARLSGVFSSAKPPKKRILLQFAEFTID
jgi:hypothetical protein